MSAGFDPYHKWLGIPPQQQPPTHYRLLGLEPFENDTDVIDAAANRIMAYLQDVSVGEDPQMAQRLLNEISAARLCLLTPQKKTEYDQALRQTAPTAAPPAARPAMPAPAPPPAPAPGAQPAAQPATPAPASIPQAAPQPVVAPTNPATAFVDPAVSSAPASGPSVLLDRKKDKSLAIWLVGGGITAAILIGAFVFASMDDSTGPGRIHETNSSNNGVSNDANTLPALLIIQMKPQDRKGAKIEINGQQKTIPPSGQIEYFVKPGIQGISITHPNHSPHEEKIGVGPSKEFTVSPKW